MAYALDLHANNPANLVEGVFTRDREAWFFIPTGGAFYTKDLVITNTYNNRALEPMTQYRVLHTNKEATMASGKEVATVILILDTTVSEIRVKRRVVGGQYENIAVEDVISPEDVEKLDITSWGQVIGEPYRYPFDPHHHFNDEIYGLEHVIYILDEITQVIATGDKKAFGMVYQFIDKKFSELRSETQGKIDDLNTRIDTVRDGARFKPGVIITMTNNTHPANALGYGTWRKVSNTLLYGVLNDRDLGMRKKVGEGPDYLMTGVYFWELVSI